MDKAKFIMSVIMITVKLSSMQRPGAVTNCLINEYKEAIIERGVKVIKGVEAHKFRFFLVIFVEIF